LHDRGKISRQNCVRCELHRFAAHDFTKTRKLKTHQTSDRLWRHIANGNSGSASRQNQPAPLALKGTDRLLNARDFIWHDCFSVNVPLTLFGEFSQSRSAQVFVLTVRSSIGDRDDADANRHRLFERSSAQDDKSFAHVSCFVFFSNLTSPMRICLSTALHI